jgi:hypothetical protein
MSHISTTNQLISLRKQRLALEKQCLSIAKQQIPEASDVRKILDALNAAFRVFATFIVTGRPTDLYSKFQHHQAEVTNIYIALKTTWQTSTFTCVTKLREVDNRIYQLIGAS